MRRNTQLSLKYTSEAGSEYLDVVFAGAISAAQWAQLQRAANTPVMEGFIPAQVGLPAPYDERIASFGVEEYDHVSTMFQHDGESCELLLTDKQPTDSRNISEFVQMFTAQKWDIQREIDRCDAGAYFDYTLQCGVSVDQDQVPESGGLLFTLVNADGVTMVDHGRVLANLSNDDALNAIGQTDGAFYRATREVALVMITPGEPHSITRAQANDPAFSDEAVSKMLKTGNTWLLSSLADAAQCMSVINDASANLRGDVGITVVALPLPWALNLENARYLPAKVEFSDSDLHSVERIKATMAVARAVQSFETHNPDAFSGHTFLLPEQRINLMVEQIKQEDAALPLFEFDGAVLRDELQQVQRQMPNIDSVENLIKTADNVVKKSAEMIVHLQQNSLTRQAEKNDNSGAVSVDIGQSVKRARN